MPSEVEGTLGGEPEKREQEGELSGKSIQPLVVAALDLVPLRHPAAGQQYWSVRRATRREGPLYLVGSGHSALEERHRLALAVGIPVRRESTAD